MEESKDAVEIGTGPVAIENFVATYDKGLYDPPPAPLEIMADRIWILFSSDFNIPRIGFNMSWIIG